jgi:alanyl-tRNA synthetase
VLPGDPTLLFANAGMNQFKDLFTGREMTDYSRAASVQKCLRVSGKHNDLETVGRTPRHHTFFEMLGNFSFGDYFKRDAIAFAWELLTSTYGLPPERLWVTVFAGTETIPADDEAFEIWADRIGVSRDRILRMGEKDNFWRMGESGPCGPCSEIHYDLGAEAGRGAADATPANDDQRFLEIWNLVFMQFDQHVDGEMVELPAPSIDTGMGLERIAAVLQGKSSNFGTDLFEPLLVVAAERAGVRRDSDPAIDFSLRVIADHARALCFLVADGVVPANDKRGYVLRRLLRRAIRHGRKLGIDEPFLHEITPAVIESLGEVYPELIAAREAIVEVGRREEQRFSETLTTGLNLLESSLAELEPGECRTLPGKDLFRLYDTYGFPLELARDIAAERNVELDDEGFRAEMARQRERARSSWKRGDARDDRGRWTELSGELESSFEGYGKSRLDGARVVALFREGQRVEAIEVGAEGEFVLDATPFYAEAGGQVADTGVLVGPSGRVSVADVQRPTGALIVHRGRVEGGALAVGDAVVAEIDEARREAVRRNHTATHLLHAALREVVGTHVKQAGSLVAPDRLRFDFSHFAALGDRALADIESLVNRKVMEDLPVETAESSLDEALRDGAMALFGEKYGERVRTVRIGDFSLELCGGTHCSRSGEIGLVKIIQERGIASGTRRVEAVSGEGSLDRFREEHAILRTLEEELAVPREKLLEEIERRMGLLRSVQKQLDGERRGSVRDRLWKKAESPQVVAGTKLVVDRVDGLGPAEIRELADGLRQKLRSGVVVLGRAFGAKASLLVSVTDDLTKRLSAGELVRELAGIIGGGGGGRRDLAEAGGKDASRLDEALEAAPRVVERRIGENS